MDLREFGDFPMESAPHDGGVADTSIRPWGELCYAELERDACGSTSTRSCLIGPETLSEFGDGLRSAVRTCRQLSDLKRALEVRRDAALDRASELTEYERDPVAMADVVMSFLPSSDRAEADAFRRRAVELSGEVGRFVERCRADVEAEVVTHQAELDDVVANLVDVNATVASASAVTADAAPSTRGLCPICMEREVDTVHTPCGHLFCVTCLYRSPGAGPRRCGMCRQIVDSSIKVFFSV